MFKKTLFMLVSLVSVLNVGCSNERETYEVKILRYEFDLAKSQTEEQGKIAEQMASINIADVEIESFMDYPIPTHFIKLHKELGIDTSKLNYSNAPWLNFAKQELSRIEQLPQTEEDTHTH